ncbi:vesicular glutamate transporter 1 isoform X1 [Danaus plexippus]|uniref:vesicular glutamate transporter 1 isoform X1 n=1 Tax=Danaus plexippus TaxID=13037 RepID=UPI000239EEF8|nr:vesicular glutamate transporter 1 isoform X1 [Danaus plexippus]
MSEENCVSDDLKRQAALFYNSTERERIDPAPESDGFSWRFWEKRRLVVALLAFFGFFNVYALRVNLSVAVIAMTEPIELELDNGTTVYVPEFDWSPQTKGLVLSSFFYGYLLTQLPGGWLASKIGGHRMFAIGVGATSLLTLFTPPLAHISTGLLVTVRVIEGLFEGVTYPCIHAVWSVWAPAGERARLASFAFSGSYVGTVVSLPVSAYLARYTGWPGIFYVSGIFGLLWTTIWWLVVKESPERDPHITAAELKYIQESRGCTRGVRSHPWRAMLSSGPVWAIVAAHFSENWGFYTLLTFLPTFMQDAFGFSTSSSGWSSAVPYLAMSLTLQVSGVLADWLLSLRRLSVTAVRRLFTCGAFVAQTVFMLGAAYSSSPSACIACLTLAVGLGGFAWSGFSVNHLDIAPPHASVLMGVSNTVATLPGIVSPALAGAIVTDKSPEQWRIVFFISSAIYLSGAALYGALCSGNRQAWVVEVEGDATFDTDGASTTTYDNKALDRSSEM